MADQLNKDPQFVTEEEIKTENERRLKSIEKIQKYSADFIRMEMICVLDADIGRALTPPPGEMLYLRKGWLIAPADKKEHLNLVVAQSQAFSGSMYGYYDPKHNPVEKLKEIESKLKVIYRRGSDYFRAAVGKAADWACVPAELLAAVLMNENQPGASGTKRAGQAVERSVQSFFGYGSTGLGNVKPDTLDRVKELFKTYYKISILRPGVPNSDQNDNAETDIYHAAAVLRDCLNKAWSAGGRSLNADQLKRYVYYPYFGGIVRSEVAIRAMGHYNGMGDAARTYGEAGMRRITKQELSLMPPK
ncbi:hypothetical protein NA78x_000997 [Anatilimnocola sp. NA78]|uniref:hypothetical protein n=1 Tax=Anatilimnocola sp. NA78 TaxID=3415683 RepID=UPI003CE59E26